MSEPLPVPPPRPAAESLPPRRGRPLFWLFAVVLLGATGYGSYRAWQWTRATIGSVSSQGEQLERLSRELAAMQKQSQDLASRQIQLSASMARTGTDVAALNGRVETTEQATSRLADVVEGSRVRVQLAAIEQLLLLANDRLLLAHDASSALKALDLADQRLAQLNDPKLFKVRETLAGERASLAAANLPDTTGLTLDLSQLEKRAATLPLRVHVPDRFTAPDAPPEPAAGAGFFARIYASVKVALSRLFVLRRNDHGAARLLGPSEEALVQQILQLRLEGARLALLAGDARTFQELIGTATSWVQEYYDESDINVKAELAELDRIGKLNLVPALPDISKSLAALRAHLGTR